MCIHCISLQSPSLVHKNLLDELTHNLTYKSYILHLTSASNLQTKAYSQCHEQSLLWMIDLFLLLHQNSGILYLLSCVKLILFIISRLDSKLSYLTMPMSVKSYLNCIMCLYCVYCFITNWFHVSCKGLTNGGICLNSDLFFCLHFCVFSNAIHLVYPVIKCFCLFCLLHLGLDIVSR